MVVRFPGASTRGINCLRKGWYESTTSLSWSMKGVRL